MNKLNSEPIYSKNFPKILYSAYVINSYFGDAFLNERHFMKYQPIFTPKSEIEKDKQKNKLQKLPHKKSNP